MEKLPLKLKVVRKHFNEECTIGEFHVNDKFFGYSLEDCYRDLGGDCSKKVYGATCIPYGTYKVTVSQSIHFGGKLLPEIHNVLCFEGIRIHGGNTAKDTLGCILVGEMTDFTTRISKCSILLNQLIEMIQNSSECEIEIFKW